jgi:murein DD-endopeptidase MepM/ murein hydrolase activator NlpD
MRYYDSLGAAGYPISGGVTREEDWQDHLSRGSLGGVDYAVGIGTPVIAPTRGEVQNNTASGPGNYVSFYHLDEASNRTGFYDQFLHLSRFVSPGTYELGDTIGFSGNTGTQTSGPHIHWHLIDPSGTRVRFWEYFTNEPIKKTGADMYYNIVAGGWQYVVGQEYIRVITAEEAKHVAWNMGEPKPHANLNDFVLWCKALNIPETVVRGLSATNRTWSKLDTISGGGGATPEVIAKAVNDDVAKRMSS